MLEMRGQKKLPEENEIIEDVKENQGEKLSSDGDLTETVLLQYRTGW